jgi:hypothetical protein
MSGPAIPHADLIRAVLDGKTVQYRPGSSDEWVDLEPLGFFDHVANHRHEYMYRIKPGLLELWIGLGDVVGGYVLRTMLHNKRDGVLSDKYIFPIKRLVRIELDPDTLAVINCTTEAP